MAVPTRALEGGFADPVLAAQRVFRALMDAMARPGMVVALAGAARPPAPLSPGAGAVALTLFDADTPLWLDPALAARDEVAAWIGFHCGAPLARNPAEAHFALASQPASLVALENFTQGTQEYPDRSATVVLQVATLAGGRRLRLAGPGIDGEAFLAPDPMPRHFVEQWQQNRARFPRGVDLILAAPDAVACLPRTTRVSAMEG